MKKLIFATILLSIFSLTSLAQTVDELQKQIVEVQNRLIQLDSSVAAVNKEKTSVAMNIWAKPYNGRGVTTNIFVNKPLQNNWNYNMFLLSGSGGFAEALHGLSKDIGKNKEINIGGYLGFQSSKVNPLRAAVSLFTSKGKNSIFMWFEQSTKSDYWYSYQMKHQVNKKTAVSLYAMRFVGHGLRVDYKPGKIGLWAGGLYDPEAKEFNVPIGIYTNF